MTHNGAVQQRSRPILLDALVLVAILALVAVLVVLQVVLRDGDGSRTAAAQETDGPVTHSSLGPTPTPTPTPRVPTPSVTPGGQAGSSPTPGEAASSLAGAAESAAARPAMLRIGTFNVLGASHTRRGGDSFMKTSYQPRMRHVMQVLGNHALDVVGFQEFESPQAALFARLGGSAWGMFPAPGSGEADGRQTIAWRKDSVELLAARTLTYPYFGGHPVDTPVVRLRLRATGDTFWVISVHNPATNCAVCGGNNDNWRDQAVAREVAAIKQLNADGTPVFLVGDMNSKEPFFCTVAAALPVVFANGGSYAGGRCRPPRPLPIDWIVATKGVSFTGFLRDDSPLVDAASDHPAYSVTAMLP